MCGYFGNLHESPAVIDLLNQLGIPLPFPVQRAYQRRSFHGLITLEDTGYCVSSAIWWYQLKADGEKLVPNEKVTSFNARDLSKPLWRQAIKTRRAIVLATELGESNGKARFLMKSEEGFALGCVYKDWEINGEHLRSFAVITRPPHERFSQYHDKSVPCFIPLDKTFIEEWLNPNIDSSPAINALLDNATLTTDLEVTKVKSYKHAEPLGETENLPKD